ncbi:MAG: hypothetical protein LBO63_01745 [Oscillospiraceae bacterium]|nr:hypothetical protein [Oscillospiraceae bacterium]
MRKRATTRGGGYFFPLRRKKVTKKGATSLEEAILFLCRAQLSLQVGAFPPRDRCGVAPKCQRTAARRGEACSGLKT